MEIRHFRPIVSLRALAFADGETSCYSISMQRVFNEEARRFSRYAEHFSITDPLRNSMTNFEKKNFPSLREQTSSSLKLIMTEHAFHGIRDPRSSWRSLDTCIIDLCRAEPLLLLLNVIVKRVAAREKRRQPKKPLIYRELPHFRFYRRNYRSSFGRYLPRFLGPVVNE